MFCVLSFSIRFSIGNEIAELTPIVTSSRAVSCYQAYGLTFVCDFALPELTAVDKSQMPLGVVPDVVIQVGQFLSPAEVQLATAPGAAFEDVTRFEAHQSSLLFSDVGRFTITGGRHILVEPLEGRGASTWRLPLLGPVLALLLEQRGLFVLHAGAVEMGGVAVAFLGEKGQGKSTLNAAFASAGYPLFSDDVVALTWPESHNSTAFPLALSGFAQIKLVPDAVRAVLRGAPSDWPAVAPELSEVDKRVFMAPLAAHPRPLRHLFVLASLDEDHKEDEHKADSVSAAEDEAVRLRALTPQQALIHLMPHTFAARFGDLYLKDGRKRTHFTQCVRVVRECRVWELARRRDLNLLPSTIDKVARAVEAAQ